MQPTEDLDGARPWCTVVICTYNRADRVGAAMASVLGQTWPDLELVVVDDGSQDHTREAVAEVGDGRVRYVHRENGGLSKARNTGIRAARGRFVAFLDDDDELEARCLERVAAVVGPERSRVVVTWGAVEATEGREVQHLPHDLGPAFGEARALVRAGTFLVDRASLAAVGGFDEGARSNHQTELFLRLLPYCRAEGIPVLAVDESLTRIHVQPAPLRPRNEPRRLLESTLRLVDRHLERLERDPELLAQYLGTAGVAAARAGEMGTARRLLRRAARTTTNRSQCWRHRARWAAASVPPVARRLWRSEDYRTNPNRAGAPS